MSVLVRPATPNDVPAIADFNAAMALETEHVRLDPPTVLAGVRAGQADPGKAAYFVAELEERVVGCCMVTREWSDWRNGDIWWLQSVYVAPAWRRRGAFRAMYEHVRSAARSAGVAAIRLYVEQGNAHAKATYESLGMTHTHYDVMEQSLR